MVIKVPRTVARKTSSKLWMSSGEQAPEGDKNDLHSVTVVGGLPHVKLAGELALEGTPMNLIQAQLGHSSLATTSRYLAHIAPAPLIEAMRSRPAFSV